jgi:hypothetical protein
MIATRNYAVRFLGQSIECQSPQDAAALQRASDILSDLAPLDFNSEERAELTVAMFRYGQYRAACHLRRLKRPEQFS